MMSRILLSEFHPLQGLLLSSFCLKLSINEGEQSKVIITKEWLEEGDEAGPVYFLIGSISRRQSPLSITAAGRGGGSAQLSFSASNSCQNFRRHVDSIVLRGRQAGKAIVSNDSSCEILSHNPRIVAQPTGEGGLLVMNGPRIRGGSVGVVGRSGEEGSRFEAELRELYGDLGLPDSMGMANQFPHLRESVTTIKGKTKQIDAENQGRSSTESSTPLNFGFEGGSFELSLSACAI
ncbi:hypothetical protein COLO4_12789 [Corchorus olitorius]|uniref:Uncharacterized protein n=1 Tax=Corchorus olitorius TaxID=93759 RepID=A0A1R3JZX1_9ROSI|nr:hypothetical protein COLO4_12789 [Corchorus olitorius]